MVPPNSLRRHYSLVLALRLQHWWRGESGDEAEFTRKRRIGRAHAGAYPLLHRAGANPGTARFCAPARWSELAADDCFYSVGFEECDDAIFPVPDAIARAPDFFGVDLGAAGQEYRWLTAAPRANAWSTR